MRIRWRISEGARASLNPANLEDDHFQYGCGESLSIILHCLTRAQSQGKGEAGKREQRQATGKGKALASGKKAIIKIDVAIAIRRIAGY